MCEDNEWDEQKTKIHVICPQNGTAVLKGVRPTADDLDRHLSNAVNGQLYSTAAHNHPLPPNPGPPTSDQNNG